ncbi:pectin acetylesterase-family hydrolase [Kribbella solani]|uniref:pectin acetylesterase-family hydrolase n=1 Tax=Kribbella solani TaxID=236067 RepID=UPI00299FD3B5|nr:pectin acetylesterase-family hydrolase [Kribbella solani]MDX3006582.1 pectin acetylesterase-family hydrolase [Kribbella solani]
MSGYLGRQRIAVLLATIVAVSATGCDGTPNAKPSMTPSALLSSSSSGSIDQAAGWETKSPGGDCECADGSRFNFYVRTGDRKKVVLYLDGGGACWSATTCGKNSGNRYQTTVEPPDKGGIFDAKNTRNPFAGYSFVYVPYCTADVHLGDADTTYASGLTIHHHGYANGTAALAELLKSFPQATDVVVVGGSAGSVSAPVYAGLVADRLPKAHITSISDSSGSFPDVPQMNKILTGKDWKAKGLPTDASMPGLFIATAKRHPGIVFARIDHSQDKDQNFHLKLAGAPSDDVAALLRTTEAQIDKAGVTLHTYTEPGDGHMVVDNEDFYIQNVDGVPLSAWVAGLIAGKPTVDVGRG